MKTIITILTFAILISCNNKSASVTEKDSTHLKFDTGATKTLALYHLGDSIAHIEFVYRVIKQVEKPVLTDSTPKKKWEAESVLDSLYFVPHPDSAKAGRLAWAPLPKQFILVDGGKNIDTLFKRHKLRFAQPEKPAVGDTIERSVVSGWTKIKKPRSSSK